MQIPDHRQGRFAETGRDGTGVPIAQPVKSSHTFSLLLLLECDCSKVLATQGVHSSSYIFLAVGLLVSSPPCSRRTPFRTGVYRLWLLVSPLLQPRTHMWSSSPAVCACCGPLYASTTRASMPTQGFSHACSSVNCG